MYYYLGCRSVFPARSPGQAYESNNREGPMRIFGIASEIEIAKLQEEHGWILIDGESIEAGFKFVRDTFMFTDKRMILIDVQGITGRKKEFLSVPYDTITKFSVETPGTP